MHRRMTITIDEAVYDALIRVIGRGKISQFLEDLPRPQVLRENIAISYQAMAADKNREQEALEWSEALLGDINRASR